MLSLLLALSAGAPSAALPSLSETLIPPALPAQAAAAEDGQPKWTGSVTVGASLSTGNSETRGATTAADAELRRAKDRFSAGFQWVYDENKNSDKDGDGSNDWNITDRKTSGKGQYDYFFTEKTYGLVQVGAENDLQAALDLRYQAGVGVGHQFREDDTLKFAGELGVTYVDEDFKVDASDTDYIAARAAYKLDWVINEAWNLGQVTEAFPSLESSDDILVKVDTRLKASLTKAMFGQLQWLLDYDNTPAQGAERVDHRFLLSIGWKF